jgi:hypothetical protein
VTLQGGEHRPFDDVFVSRGGPDQFARQVRPFGEILGNLETVQDAFGTGTIVKQS